jgi:hypothetical protein
VKTVTFNMNDIIKDKGYWAKQDKIRKEEEDEQEG